MQKKPGPKEVLQVITSLQNNPEAQRQTVDAPKNDPQLHRLRAWQARRLAGTYADLLADQQYGQACRFFLDDLYGSRDFSQRDVDAERLHAILSRFLPERTLRLLADALRLNQLSKRLDERLALAVADILNQAARQGEITCEVYAQGYRICNNFSERKEQIELLAGVLREAALGGRGRIFRAGLRLARQPAHAAGWDELHSFLERGATACTPMKDVDYFVNTIHRRETAILENIFAERPNPLEVV